MAYVGQRGGCALIRVAVPPKRCVLDGGGEGNRQPRRERKKSLRDVRSQGSSGFGGRVGKASRKEGTTVRRCHKTTLSQNHCHKTNVTKPMSQNQCHKTNVTKLMSQTQCRKHMSQTHVANTEESSQLNFKDMIEHHHTPTILLLIYNSSNPIKKSEGKAGGAAKIFNPINLSPESLEHHLFLLILSISNIK